MGSENGRKHPAGSAAAGLTTSRTLHTFVNVCNPVVNRDRLRSLRTQRDGHDAPKSKPLPRAQRLLDAAERVFRERGVAHASLAEVAAAAGVTRGAVYWHFRDKADLFEALCERVQLPMEAMLASAGEIRQKDPLGALRALAVNGLVRLATNARTQAVFDVIFHKCEFAAEFASVAGSPPRHRHRLPRQRRAPAEAGGDAPDSFRATPTPSSRRVASTHTWSA